MTVDKAGEFRRTVLFRNGDELQKQQAGGLPTSRNPRLDAAGPLLFQTLVETPRHFSRVSPAPPEGPRGRSDCSGPRNPGAR
jgi:hypothetical protein